MVAQSAYFECEKSVNLPPMKEIVDKELRTSVLEKTRKSLVDGKISVSRKELKSDIFFTTKGLKEALNQPHFAYNEKNYAVLNIVELIKGSKYIGFKKDSKERAEINGFHYFEIQICGKNSYILIMERRTGENIFYTISDKK